MGMEICNFANCKKVKKNAVERRIEALRKKYEQQRDKKLSKDEMLRLKEAITCKVCKQLCSKAVSLPCCSSASCRNCAIGKLREDNTKCWSCGELSEDVNTLSQLVNNDLVRVCVTFYKERQMDRSIGTFEIFVLLANTDILESRDHFKNEKLLKRKLAHNAAKERERETAAKNSKQETKPLSDMEQAQLKKLLRRNKTKLERNVEPTQCQLEVRDIFTGTGIVKLNKKIGKGRLFDGTTIQRNVTPGCRHGRRQRHNLPTIHHPP